MNCILPTRFAIVPTFALSFFAFDFAAGANEFIHHSEDHQCAKPDPVADTGIFIPETPAGFETYPDGSRPEPARDDQKTAMADVIAPAAGQPAGPLSGRIVFTSAGHGWTKGSSTWALQRGVIAEMNEDYGNVDQMNIFATYCFNAGATVVAMRPIGFQTNEVILDNVSAGVTFSGTWNNSTQTTYYGLAGQVPYRWASLASSETATATYTPNIPVAGFYPVYTWVKHDSDRTSQLYRIRHTGGESLVRVPHHMVGNGWVYLGTYYFNAGSNTTNGAVVISNLQPTPAVGSVTIADAIRFGNGMSVDGSTYPKEEEASRYWVKSSLGQGQSSSIYDSSATDIDDNVGTPPRMAREMNRQAEGNMFKRIYIGFHSNATSGNTNTATARGSLGLYNNTNLFPGTATANQVRLAQIIGREVTDDLKALNSQLEFAWFDRGTGTAFARSDFAFGEINNGNINNEFDATIVEVAFHDNHQDARLLRDPKVRNWIGRACYHAVIKHMNEFDGLPLNFLPEPPTNVRAVAGTSDIMLSWTAPVAQGGSGSPSSYVIYRSTDGYGFGNPISVAGTSYVISGLSADTDYYFRVAAVNAGGESLPSETVGCRRNSTLSGGKVLFVNAFDRFDRNINLRQTPAPVAYKIPGHNNNSGTMERVLPRSINSSDYVVQYGKALSAAGKAFNSCSRTAILNGQISLANYPIVIWSSGHQITNSVPTAAQNLLTNFLAGGRNLFITGSEIARDLDRASGPTTADRAFLNNWLRARLNSDANTNSGSYTFTPVAGSVFAGNSNGTFDNGDKGIYWVRAADVLTPNGTGATAAINYVGGIGGAAAVQFASPAGGGRVMYWGFPFETITSATVRNQYMADVMNFLTVIAPTISAPPQSLTAVQESNVTFTVTAAGTEVNYQWQFGGTPINGATQSSYTRNNVQTNHAGNYRVIVANSAGSITSAVAVLTVTAPPSIAQQPQSQAVFENTDAAFSVSATGTAPLSYQWHFNDAPIFGATTNSYTRSGAQLDDAGNYFVVISNVAGTVTSSNAVLTVQIIPPSFGPIVLLEDEIQMRINGVSGRTYAIETSENLIDWTTLTNLMLTNGTVEFADPVRTNVPALFYRATTSGQ